VFEFVQYKVNYNITLDGYCILSSIIRTFLC